MLRSATVLRQRMRQAAETLGEVEVLGPAPAPVVKVDNRYRYRLLWVGKNDSATRSALAGLLKEFAADGKNRGVSAFIDCNE